MTKTPDEIKKGLECCGASIYQCADDCPYRDECRIGQGGKAMMEDALALIQQLEDRNNALYHTILGVMHFVDKWLNDKGYDPESDQNGSIAIDRAARAREIALRAIEEAEKRQPF